MWISLFLLQGIFVFALGAENCILNVLGCDGYRVTLHKRVYFKGLIQKQSQLDRKCRSLQPFIECLDTATTNCFQAGLTSGLSPTELGFLETRRLITQLCGNSGEEFKKSFLESANCINRQFEYMETVCDTADLRQSILERFPATTFSCEYQKALLGCQERIIHMECGEEASIMFQRIMWLELNMDYVCMDKTNFKEPGGFLSDIINGFIILLVDTFKEVLRIPEVGVIKDLPSRVETLLGQSGNLKNEELTEGLNDDFPFSEEVCDDKDSETCRNKHVNELRRMGNILINLKDGKDGSLEVDMDVEDTSAIDFYSAMLTKCTWLLKSREQKQASDTLGSCYTDECGKSRFAETYKEPEPAAGDEYKDTVNDAEINFNSRSLNLELGKETLSNDYNLEADESSEPEDDSRMKINYMIVGEAYLPLEVHYSNQGEDYTQSVDMRISNRKYRLTPSTETVPSMSSEDVEESTDLKSEVEECGYVKGKQNLYLEDKTSEDMPEEPSCEIKSNVTPIDFHPQVPNFNQNGNMAKAEQSHLEENSEFLTDSEGFN